MINILESLASLGGRKNDGLVQASLQLLTLLSVTTTTFDAPSSKFLNKQIMTISKLLFSSEEQISKRAAQIYYQNISMNFQALGPLELDEIVGILAKIITVKPELASPITMTLENIYEIIPDNDKVLSSLDGAIDILTEFPLRPVEILDETIESAWDYAYSIVMSIIQESCYQNYPEKIYKVTIKLYDTLTKRLKTLPLIAQTIITKCIFSVMQVI